MVKECNSQTQDHLLIAALREYAGSNVIVYSPTIARVDETISLLKRKGIAAIGYHGKMNADERRRNQESWMTDEVRVLVGTVAFGLGINKAAVRAVIHLSLPKSIEQYYQEAGRAGRDGLPADCIMLWQKQDASLLNFFINRLKDPLEQGRARERYQTMREFVDSHECRHRAICLHFGEKPKWKTCAACDVCGYVLRSLSPKAPSLVKQLPFVSRQAVARVKLLSAKWFHAGPNPGATSSARSRVFFERACPSHAAGKF